MRALGQARFLLQGVAAVPGAPRPARRTVVTVTDDLPEDCHSPSREPR